MAEDVELDNDEGGEITPSIDNTRGFKTVAVRNGKVKIVGISGQDIFRCRKCGEFKAAGGSTGFWKATDTYLDTNGRMSICIECVCEMYEAIYKVEKSFDKTILKVCRILNIKYDSDIVDRTINELVRLNKPHDSGKCFGIYKKFLYTSSPAEIGKRDVYSSMDFMFHEPMSNTPIVSKNYRKPKAKKVLESENESDISNKTDEVDDGPIDYESEGVDKPVLLFWGEGYHKEDYEYLERELADWKKTHPSGTKSEITLLKELCYKELDIRHARMAGQPTAGLVKELQDIMKTAAVDPGKATASGSGKSLDRFSEFIKMIEENEPADLYKEPGAFKDVDNIDFYFKKYITRPLKNFVTGSRDFNVTDESNDDLDEEPGEVEDNGSV